LIEKPDVNILDSDEAREKVTVKYVEKTSSEAVLLYILIALIAILIPVCIMVFCLCKKNKVIDFEVA